jgi:hypothetical protein
VRKIAPLVSVRAFARRAFGMSSAAMFIYTGALFGFMVVLPVYFQVVRGERSLALLAAALFVAGLGHGTIMPPVMGASYQRMPKPEIPAATAAFNVVIRVGSSFGTAALAVLLQQAIRARIPGASGNLSAAARLHGTHALSLLTSAFGSCFWWVAAIAAAAAIPAIFIPRRPAPARADDAGPDASSVLVTE